MLGCTTGVIVAIDFASYGTPQGSCGSFTRGRCDASTSVAVVASACIGKAECELFVAHETFGVESCAGTDSLLAVQAECSLPTPTATYTTAATATSVPASSPTPTPTPPACTGDCDGDQHVEVSELLLLVDIALGNQPASRCTTGAGNGTTIGITEVIAAVRHAVDGCPGT